MLIDNRKALEDAEIKIQIHTIDHCVRCGVPIQNVWKSKRNLWCSHCREYVNAELNGGEEHPFDFYFQYLQECNKSNVKDAENG